MHGNMDILREDPYNNAPISIESTSKTNDGTRQREGKPDYGFEFEKRKGHSVLIFRGEHKGRWAQFVASNATMAQVHFEAGGMTVNVPLESLYDA